MEDTEIIELYFSRNENAIEKTNEKYGSYLKKIAYNILSDEFESDECLNDTYFKTWNKIPPERPSVFSAFLAKITRNTAIDKYRMKKREKRCRVEESLDELSECVGESDTQIALDLIELGSLISDFLRGEKEKARIIFIRRYFFEDSVSEIANHLFLSESNVKTSLSRTRAKLSVYLRYKGVML